MVLRLGRRAAKVKASGDVQLKIGHADGRPVHDDLDPMQPGIIDARGDWFECVLFGDNKRGAGFKHRRFPFEHFARRRAVGLLMMDHIVDQYRLLLVCIRMHRYQNLDCPTKRDLTIFQPQLN
ncbi:MAG: hypothetical protein ACI861_002534 [Paracoccaceae bacterium]